MTTSIESARGDISIRRLRKTFSLEGKPFDVFRDLNLHIDSGQSIAIVGPSGCGKTTLLRILAGLETPDGGDVVIDGQAVHGMSRERAVIFQEPRLLPWLTVLENVSFSLDVQGVPRKKARERAKEAIELVGLSHCEQALPNQLSGGMAQRVTIALAACSRARLLIADEPTNGLDEASRRQFFALLDSIFPDTVKIIITHDISVAALCTRILVLCGGRMLETGLSGAVLRAPRNPYTRALLAAQVANGMQPSPVLREGRSGCPFYARCPEADAACRSDTPQVHKDADREWWCCHG